VAGAVGHRGLFRILSGRPAQIVVIVAFGIVLLHKDVEGDSPIHYWANILTVEIASAFREPSHRHLIEESILVRGAGINVIGFVQRDEYGAHSAFRVGLVAEDARFGGARPAHYSGGVAP